MKGKDYNAVLARQIIDYFEPFGLEEGKMGMHEDWFWTAASVWSREEGYKKVHALRDHEAPLPITETEVMINGITGSTWATPVIELRFADGYRVFKCYTGADEHDTIKALEMSMRWASGCMSQPVQLDRAACEIADFKKMG